MYIGKYIILNKGLRQLAIKDNFEIFKIIEERIVPDGMGGFDTEWVDGADIMGYLSLQTSTEVRIAEQEGYTSIYVLTTEQTTPIDYRMVIRRQDDKKIFKLTSHPEKNPKTSNISFWHTTAERFELPVV